MKPLPWYLRGLLSGPLLGLIGRVKISDGDRRRFVEVDGLTPEQVANVESAVRTVLYNRVAELLGMVPAGPEGI